MVNYQKGKIYKVVSDQVEYCYVGSTCQTLSMRLAGHRAQYKRYLAGKIKYSISSFELLKYKDHHIVLIESYPCDNKDQLRAREEYYRVLIDSCNKQKAWTGAATKKEYSKMYCEENKEKIAKAMKKYRKVYHEKNKEKIAETMKKYYEGNKEKISASGKAYYERNKERLSEKITCECGVVVIKRNLTRHKKTQKHQNVIV